MGGRAVRASGRASARYEDKKEKTLFTLERISYVACVIGYLVALLSLLYSLLS